MWGFLFTSQAKKTTEEQNEETTTEWGGDPRCRSEQRFKKTYVFDHLAAVKGAHVCGVGYFLRHLSTVDLICRLQLSLQQREKKQKSAWLCECEAVLHLMMIILPLLHSQTREWAEEQQPRSWKGFGMLIKQAALGAWSRVLNWDL